MSGDNKAEANNVKVMVRMRLFNSREINESKKKKERLQPVVRMRDKTCSILEHTVDDKGFSHERERDAFQFDECFWSMPPEQHSSEVPHANQQYVYERSGYLAMKAAFSGFNVCIFAYGQTGSGKTYSMLGAMPHDPGVSPRLCDDLFKEMEQVALLQPVKCAVECTFFEIYNEKCRDLFNKKSKLGHYDNVKIRQHPTKGVYVDGLIRKEVTTAEAAKAEIEKGTGERAMAETAMNKTSSRSHAVFQLQLTQMNPLQGTQRVATINLVDLAGSEKIKKSEAEGMTFTEATNINKSLSTLRRVIDILIENSEGGKQHVAPFRESVLTYCLMDSLGGNSKTQMIATISPHTSNLEDTLSTLRYALRAKAIVCNAKVNEEKSAEMMDAMKDEIETLRKQLATGGGGGGKAMPADIQREIAIREQEVKKMETEQKKMEEQVEEFKEKEKEMQQELHNVAEQKAELSIAVNAQKRERFATAFRSAFMLHKDKRRIEESTLELEQTKIERDETKQQYEFLSEEYKARAIELGDTTVERDKLLAENQKMKETTQDEIAKLTRQAEEGHNLSKSLRGQLDTANKQLSRTTFEKEELDGRYARMQEDMIGLTHAVEREQMEKSKIIDELDSSAQQSSKTIEEIRKRKERYKQHQIEEAGRSRALQAAIEAHRQDRSSLLETIKAQQQLLSEKDVIIDAVNKALDEEKKKAAYYEQMAEKKRSDAAALSEALKEYQKSSTQWMAEHSIMDKELCRLRMSTGGSTYAPLSPTKSLQRQTSTASVPYPLLRTSQSPKRAQSPSTAARARSPYFKQPKVELSRNQYSDPHRPVWQSPRATQ